MMTRECPVCHVPLKQVTIKNRVQLDFCLTCRGIWCDKNELSQVYEHGRVPEKFVGGPPLTRDHVVCDACGTQNERSKRQCTHCGNPLSFLCPVCHIHMEETPVGNVLIDRCKRCQGVWLDGGELAMLFEAFKQDKQKEVAGIRNEGGEIAGNLAAWAAIDALDMLMWRPGVAYRTGEAVTDAVIGIPGAVAEGAGAVVEGIGNIPEAAGNVAAGTVEFASSAADVAGDVLGNIPEVAGEVAAGTVEFASSAADVVGDVLEGAADLAGEVPEIAGAVAEAAGSFIELLFEIIGSLFDQ